MSCECTYLEELTTVNVDAATEISLSNSQLYKNNNLHASNPSQPLTHHKTLSHSSDSTNIQNSSEEIYSNVKFFVQSTHNQYWTDDSLDSECSDPKYVCQGTWQETDYIQRLNSYLVPRTSLNSWNGIASDGELGNTLLKRPPGNLLHPNHETIAKKYDLQICKNFSENKRARDQSLGCMSVLSDEMVAKILFHLGLADLKSLLVVSSLSRAIYQISGWELKIWRPLCLERHNGNFTFSGSWKITTFYPKIQQDYQKPLLQLLELWSDQMLLRDKLPSYAAQQHVQHTQNNDNDANPYLCSKKHVPINGFFSKKMYDDWWFSQLKLGGWFHDTKQVPRIRAADYSASRFADEFMTHNLPCIITDVVPHWNAFKAWQAEQFLENYSETLFKVNEYSVSNDRIKMKFRDFLIYCRKSMDSKPLYVFDDSFEKRAPSLLQDYSVPEYFWENLFCAFHPNVKIASKWWLCGPSHSGTPIHKDPYGTSAWNALITGHKRWILYPPSIKPPQFKKCRNVLKWLKHVYPLLRDDQKPIEFIQHPGDMVFIPSKWWHAVLNLDYTVSVTQNMANTYNLKNVISSMNKTPKLLECFKCCLLPVRPEIYKSI